MRILISNDDGYTAKGIKTLAKIMREFGEITVIGPKYHQSGMSMAVTMGLKPIAVKKLSEEPGESWYYVDGTPSSCVKYGIDEVFADGRPDLVVTGINHGANAGTADAYSGTLGAAKEGALADVISIGVSIDTLNPDADFTAVEAMLPGIIRQIIRHASDRRGVYYNVNFPDIPLSQIQGVRLAHEGIMHWEKEFEPYDYNIFDKLGITPQAMGITAMPEVEPGEQVFIMRGVIVDDLRNAPGADHHLLSEGFVTVTVHNLYTTDFTELDRLRGDGFESDCNS